MNSFSIFNILELAGGLAVFLYGMHILSEALEKKSGGRLKKILESLTSSSFKGLILGIGVTAIIQSSSATTVMVIGFVNSGIMSLSQSIGIIMGANIGTTVTPWLLSLAGIQGDSLFLNFLKPSSFSPVFAVLGVIFIIFTKSTAKKDVGTIFLGFAILMFGMEQMSGAVKPLADVPEFTNILTLFSNPVLGVLAGALLTAIIQSSSASVGILQALSVTGGITFASAIPIITGQNIGTCITALISSVGANKNAKRAAVIHLVFNVLGTLLFLALFYILNTLINFGFVSKPVNTAQIAIIHTAFNVFATTVIFPFNKVLEKIACMIVREEKAASQKNILLDERFLSTPSVAILRAKELTDKMAILSFEMLSGAIDMLCNYDEEKNKKIISLEDKMDMYEDELGSYLVKMSGKNLSASLSHQISKFLHSIGDFERIGDHSINICESAQEIKNKNIIFSDEARKEIEIISSAVKEILDMAVKAFVDDDIALAKNVEPLEEVIDNLKAKLKANHIDRVKKTEYTIEVGFVFSDIITDLERVADHCSNIAVCIIQISQDSFDVHKYLSNLKRYGENSFKEQYEKYAEKYKI
ncbi:MAG: Na/Pi cotransporter family protein [Ruminococcaceae bacterium]|nr:Na/Pi cotransporter family protein [Oscillospiraceae bacterium]